MSNGQLAAGTLIYIGAAAPATYDKAGYEAVVWTAIGEVTDITGEIGAMHTTPTYSKLGSRGIVKRLGQYDNGNPVVSYKYYPADSGQEDILAVVGVNTPNAIKIVVPTATQSHIYFMALVPGAPVQIGSTEDFIFCDVTLAIDSVSNVLTENAPV